ncbi:MAG: hypothetical protein EOO24_67135, partial [Comamonadaceae bacterium]
MNRQGRRDRPAGRARPHAPAAGYTFAIDRALEAGSKGGPDRVTRDCREGADCDPLPGDSPMPGLLPDIDPDGLLEFSVVYTDRALNHMS